MQVTKIEAIKFQPQYQRLRVAAYARVSTSMDEQLESLAIQKEHYENEIKSNPEYEFAGLYYDEGVSGTKMAKREGLQDLLRDCRKGKIDKIMTKSISRFSRNLTDCLMMVRELTDLHVGIYFEKENIDTLKMDSDLILSIMSSLAESESKSISQNLKWSIKNRMKDGTYIISNPCYGYNKKGKNLVINKEEAKIVKEIFTRYVDGDSSYKIVDDLNKRKIKTKRNTKWTCATVLSIIKNEKYTGSALLQKTYTDESFNRHKNIGELNSYLIKNHHPAIISEELYDEANSVLEERRKQNNTEVGSTKYANRYSFTGKIICGGCGRKLKRIIYNRKDIRYAAWECASHKNGKCSMKFIREDSIKDAFIRMLNKLSQTYKEILIPLSKELSNADKNINNKELDKIEASLKEVHNKKQGLRDLFNSGLVDNSKYNSELTKLNLEESRYLSKRKEINKCEDNEDERLIELKNLIKAVSNKKLFDSFDEALFNQLINKVVVEERFVIVFNLKCGLSFKEGAEEFVCV